MANYTDIAPGKKIVATDKDTNCFFFTVISMYRAVDRKGNEFFLNRRGESGTLYVGHYEVAGYIV